MKSMNTQSNFNWYFNRKNRVAYYIFHNKGILAVDIKKKQLLRVVIKSLFYWFRALYQLYSLLKFLFVLPVFDSTTQ